MQEKYRTEEWSAHDHLDFLFGPDYNDIHVDLKNETLLRQCVKNSILAVAESGGIYKEVTWQHKAGILVEKFFSGEILSLEDSDAEREIEIFKRADIYLKTGEGNPEDVQFAVARMAEHMITIVAIRRRYAYQLHHMLPENVEPIFAKNIGRISEVITAVQRLQF